jgi:hypothetical protein
MHCQHHRPTRVVQSILTACCLLTGAVPAFATTLDFESHTNILSPVLGSGDTAYAGRDRFTTGGYTATVADSVYAQSLPDYEPGAAGVIVDHSDRLACSIVTCPGSFFNQTHYYAGLNDSSLTLARSDGLAFRLLSLDFAFVAPMYDLANLSYGQLVLSATAEGSSDPITRAMNLPGQFLDGNFIFDTWQLDDAFSGLKLTSLNISACVFDEGLNCVNGATSYNLAQFAIDNVHLEAVPEPQDWLVFASGLGLLAAIGRRRRGASGAAGVAGGAA